MRELSYFKAGAFMPQDLGMKLPLIGQVAMVSGAASGFGAAVAFRALALGADVIANYRSDYGVLGDVESAADKVGRRLMILQGDVSRDEDCKAMAAAEWGRVDMLVNNAGTTKHVPRAMLSEDFNRILQVNVIGVVQLTRAILHLLRIAYEQRDRARPVVMDSSVAGVIANGSSIAYSASKVAMNNMTIALARSLAPALRVNAICPGIMDTPWFEKGAGAEQAAKVRALAVAHTPLKSVPTADEMAKTVLMLCCSETAHVTGVNLLVDDGLSMLLGS